MTNSQTPEGGEVEPVALRPGALVRLVSTTDQHTRLTPGATGYVELVDDAGTIHVRWDEGSSLGLVPGEDVWEVVHERWWNAPFGTAEENPR